MCIKNVRFWPALYMFTFRWVPLGLGIKSEWGRNQLPPPPLELPMDN